MKPALCYLLWFCLILSAPVHSIERQVIHSAVSPTFADGVHARLLRFMAQELDMELYIYEIPLARRLQMLSSGELDLLVGLHKTQDRMQKLAFVPQAYDYTSAALFTLAHKTASVNTFADLMNVRVGVLFGSKYFPQFDAAKDIERLPVSSLEQSIALLQKHRIDVFIHNKAGAQKILSRKGLNGDIRLANYQPTYTVPVYFATSKNSHLFGKISNMEMIVSKIASKKYRLITN